ncbi:MAG: AraC family transcriptional regulator [Proteiniphilum sp.]|nr:AraC family transcriptional regulator [Proteiniphilum sp.]MDD4453539.1 AraC family transcriptional regulator [Proteiniphilum sp.]
MEHLYISTIFAGALVCLLSSILLFARRKSGERSRVILAIIVFFSVLNYIPRFIALTNGYEPEFAVSAKPLLIANFMVISYIMYPIEVILPGWLNFSRIVKLYAFWLILLFVYIYTIYAGVQYTPYSSIPEMFAQAEKFEVWFRLLLCLFLLTPGLFVIFIYYVKHHNNTDSVWLKKYATAFYINIIAFVLVLIFKEPLLHILYYYVSVGCSLYIVYMELFDRLLVKKVKNKQTDVEASQEEISSVLETASLESQKSELTKRLDAYMHKNSAWRDPNLSLTRLASDLYTNRTTLAQAMHDSGYENYINYINKLRIDDFLRHIESGQSSNYQEAFFFVGFRSRSTALRNFKKYTGTIPSDYFKGDSC